HLLLLHLHYFLFFFILLPPPPRSTLFPYTTLFRSHGGCEERPARDHIDDQKPERDRRGPDQAGDEPFAQDPRQLHEFQYRIAPRSEEHTSELQSRFDLVCRLLLEKKKKKKIKTT